MNILKRFIKLWDKSPSFTQAIVTSTTPIDNLCFAGVASSKANEAVKNKD